MPHFSAVALFSFAIVLSSAMRWEPSAVAQTTEADVPHAKTRSPLDSPPSHQPSQSTVIQENQRLAALGVLARTFDTTISIIESRFRLIIVEPVVGAEEGVSKALSPFKLPGFPELDPKLQTTSEIPGRVPSDHYRVSAKDGIVTVEAPTGVSLCAGAYRYLKSKLRGQVTWGEHRTGISIPHLNELFTQAHHWPDLLPELHRAHSPIRYAWNVCTFSYSAVWWDFNRWQKEIDWMALHGINMPLASTGVEFLWMKVFEREFNISVKELQNEWFVGPAFLAWGRMGNLRRFGGPLRLEWILQQKDLSIQILRAMRSLGMKPVLSCFAGHVPEILVKLSGNRRRPNGDDATSDGLATRSIGEPFSSAVYTRNSRWGGFATLDTKVWFLSPNRSPAAYKALGAAFMRVQEEFYGDKGRRGGGYYNCDAFNEVDPLDDDSTETMLAASSNAVVSTIRQVDPDGVWVVQGWMFYFSQFWNEARVRAYSPLLILDLFSEQQVVADKFPDYYQLGPWVWNMLHTFGGVRGLYGDLPLLHSLYTDIATKQASGQWKGLVGLGMTPEAIEHNAVVYERLTDLFYETASGQLGAWLAEFGLQRYGAVTSEHQLLSSEVWRRFGRTMYAGGLGHLIRSHMDQIPFIPNKQISSARKADRKSVV